MANNRVMFTFKNWRIRRADSKNLVIERFVRMEDNDTGEMKGVWQFNGYYSRFERAINGLADAIGFHADSLEDASTQIREMRHTVERLMKGIS